MLWPQTDYVTPPLCDEIVILLVLLTRVDFKLHFFEIQLMFLSVDVTVFCITVAPTSANLQAEVQKLL